MDISLISFSFVQSWRTWGLSSLKLSQVDSLGSTQPINSKAHALLATSHLRTTVGTSLLIVVHSVSTSPPILSNLYASHDRHSANRPT